jgi:hypothetical protein
VDPPSGYRPSPWAPRAATVESMTLTLRAKSPEDLLAAVPVALGFEPQDSVVMLTFGGPTPFHARIDLPPPGDPAALTSVIDALLDPCRRHRTGRVVFVLYGSAAIHCRQVARRLRRAFEAERIEVVECLRADRGRWFSADGRRSGVPPRGVPYDTGAHPFRAEAVMAGHVTRGSRDDVAASIGPDLEAAAALEVLTESAALLDAAELAALCRRHADAGTVPSDAEAAAMLRTIQIGVLRDAAWARLTREDAARHVALWKDLVRRAPAEVVPSAAAVLAFAAWLQGDGALAWCALDRCFAVDPEHRLGVLVSHLLADAMPPAAWASMHDEMAELLGIPCHESESGMATWRAG